MSHESIEPLRLKEWIDRNESFALLDVREDDERSYCSLEAPETIVDLHIPMREIPPRFDEIAGTPKPIVVYCHHGVRSMVVVRWLLSRGVTNVLNLDGGIDAWSLQVDPGVPRY